MVHRLLMMSLLSEHTRTGMVAELPNLLIVVTSFLLAVLTCGLSFLHLVFAAFLFHAQPLFNLRRTGADGITRIFIISDPCTDIYTQTTVQEVSRSWSHTVL
jgi:hypothetical protein